MFLGIVDVARKFVLAQLSRKPKDFISDGVPADFFRGSKEVTLFENSTPAKKIRRVASPAPLPPPPPPPPQRTLNFKPLSRGPCCSLPPNSQSASRKPAAKLTHAMPRARLPN